MRRLLSILLLAVFTAPLFAPLLAFGEAGDAGLPACCRRNGAHHCAMSASMRRMLLEETRRSGDPVVHTLTPKCPYLPATPAPVHTGVLHTPTVAQSIFAGIVSHPAGTPQTESLRRISRDRSRQKRGPPTLA